jgi:hypothetical protein
MPAACCHQSVEKRGRKKSILFLSQSLYDCSSPLRRSSKLCVSLIYFTLFITKQSCTETPSMLPAIKHVSRLFLPQHIDHSMQRCYAMLQKSYKAQKSI